MENRPAPLRSRRVCRFCLTENDPLSFIYDRELSRPFQVPLTLQIMSCVSIEVYSADGMPQMICQNCRWNLDRCYKFKQQCKKADEALRAYPISGVLPRPFPPITNDPPETSNKRNLENRSPNEQAKKARLDNGDRERERREPAHTGQRQIETRAEKQQREKEERRDLYDADQDAGSEGEQEPNDSKEDSKLEPGEIRVHACNQCDRTFPLLQSLQLHVQRAHRDRDYKCTECDRMFFSKYDLTKHMSTHSEEKPYSCQICQKQFSRANLLQRHEKVHREELRYGCPHCEREFFTPEELEKHEEAVHKTVKPFQCNICNKRFTYKQGLERHEMLHNEDKSFVCEYCKEAFRTSTKLARHLTSHAGHRPYMCKLCPRTFLLSHHLTRHMRSHSVEKRHQCEDCGKAFKRKESLEVHQLTHVKRTGMGLTCDVCQESCRNRADYVTHIKQHIEAGEKMGPDGLPPDSKEKIGVESESEEEEEEEEEQYSDDDYEPPSSYVYASKKNLQKASQKTKVESEEDQVDKEDKKEQVVYVRGKDGNLVKKTIKTLMPIQRRTEQTQEMKPKATGSSQVVNSTKTKEDIQPVQQPVQQPAQKTGRVDETEAQVQKIVASVFKEHKIPLKHQTQEQNKESPQTLTRQASQPVLTPTIIKEEKIDPPLTPIPKNTVKVIKRILVRKPGGSMDAQSAITAPIQEAVAAAAASAQATPSTSGPKVTKRVIVRRIIRQGDTTREVIMNPDGSIIDPAELAKLPTGNVVKRVVVKKPLDKGQNIEAMLQAADTKRIIRLAESGEDLGKVAIVASPKTHTQVQRVEFPSQPKQVILEDDREKNEKIEQLQKRVEQQRRTIEELQRKHEYETGDDMLPERHDESEDEQQLPLKRVFVKRKQSIYDEEREYNDDISTKDKEESEETAIEIGTASSEDMAKEEKQSQNSVVEKVLSPSQSIEEAKIIIIKPEENQPDVDEMSRELCNILDSTETVVKMQENVLNNLTQIATIDTPTNKAYAEVAEEAVSQEETLETTMEQPMEQEEIVTDDLEHHEQVAEEVNGQQDPALKIVITQSENDGVKLEFEGATVENSEIVTTEESNIERTESELPTLSTQVLSESNDIFESSETAMEVEVEKSQEQSNMDESVIELSTTNVEINLNETTDSRDSLEVKLSQMEG